VVRRIWSSIRQYETHRQLIGRVRSAAGRVRTNLDAIIVPASRKASNLDHAVTLARAAACELVIFCSRETLVTDVLGLLAERCFDRAAVVQLPDGYDHPALRFVSSDLSRGHMTDMCVSPNGDLSTKRNLGLLLARMLHWDRILFMDDDVRDVSLADLQATVSLLSRYQSVGMRVTNFPDNSVVCHAHRATGAIQDVFVSGSVLALNPQKPVGFFPEIYNEDWFFFYDDVRTGQLAWSGRDATQLQYDPFRNTQRAERQEFGDVLAEGLYALLHVGAGLADADRDYWVAFIAERRRFLQSIIRRSDKAVLEIRDNMLDAVHAALHCLRQVKPETCESYVQVWRKDREAWLKDLAAMPAVESLDAALAELGLARSRGREAGRLPLPANTEPDRSVAAGPVLIPQLATAGFLLSRNAAALTRGRSRRGRLPVPSGLPADGPAVRPNYREPELGQGISGKDTTAETQPMHLSLPPIPQPPDAVGGGSLGMGGAVR
jgi:hypothetical protein